MTEHRYRAVRLLKCPHHKVEYTRRCPKCVEAWNADLERIRKPRRRVHLATGLKRVG